MNEIIGNDPKLRRLILSSSCRRVKDDLSLDYIRSHLYAIDLT